MKRLTLFVLLLIASNAHANKGDLWLDIYLWSWHSADVWFDEDGLPQNWNKNNYGIGLGYGLFDSLEVKGGIYDNSHHETSIYAGIKWHTDYERFVSVGIQVGLVTGYEVTQAVDTVVTPYILPTLTFHPHYRVRIEIGYLPGIQLGGKQQRRVGNRVLQSEAADLVTGTVGILF